MKKINIKAFSSDPYKFWKEVPLIVTIRNKPFVKIIPIKKEEKESLLYT